MQDPEFEPRLPPKKKNYQRHLKKLARRKRSRPKGISKEVACKPKHAYHYNVGEDIILKHQI